MQTRLSRWGSQTVVVLGLNSPLPTGGTSPPQHWPTRVAWARALRRTRMTLANTPAGSPEESSGDAVQTLMTARLPGPGGRSKAPPKGLAALETVAAQVQLYDSAACSDDDEQEEQSADAKKAPKDGGEKPWLETMWPPAGTPQRRAFVARTAASWALLAATMALYIMVFTAMGAGLTVYEALLPAKTYALVRFSR